MIDINSKVCAFCGFHLSAGATPNYYSCLTSTCYHAYTLHAPNKQEGGYIQYRIGRTIFTYWFDKDCNPEKMLVDYKFRKFVFQIDSHIEATKENYLQIINRCKKLQAFK